MRWLDRAGPPAPSFAFSFAARRVLRGMLFLTNVNYAEAMAQRGCWTTQSTPRPLPSGYATAVMMDGLTRNLGRLSRWSLGRSSTQTMSRWSLRLKEDTTPLQIVSSDIPASFSDVHIRILYMHYYENDWKCVSTLLLNELLCQV